MAAAIGNKYAVKYDDNEIEQLCNSLLNFAEQERQAHFATWARRQKKSSQWLYEMANNYPKFAEAMDTARALMSAKLLTSSVYKDDPNFQPQYAMQYLPIYDKQFQEHLKWKADINREQPKEDSKSGVNQYLEQQIKK
jgi:hypothetical protein